MHDQKVQCFEKFINIQKVKNAKKQMNSKNEHKKC